MGRLHDPGPGEILDRLTILQLKILHGKLQGVDVTHWVAEHDGLGDALVRLADALERRTHLEEVLELAAVNAALWQAEDDLRRERTATEHYVSQTAVIAQTAIRIQTLNDRRAELITLINTNAGHPSPPEKL